ncbi:MAG: TPM domain-containing protein [Opitutaceae bacterium]|nr:TPM domain-containing protein [Opitutaceae bacterium]
MRWRVLLPLLVSLLSSGARAAEVIPPAPRDHFNDYGGIVSTGLARRLNDELAQFERKTSHQVLVAIYPQMASASSIEDYTVRVAQAWRAGQQERRNGAVLFIFSQDRKLFVQVGYGLEGVLPDALCKRIIDNEIVPRFRGGDFDGGVQAGVHALLAATRGEYQGNGRTVADQVRPDSGFFNLIVVIIVAVFLLRVVYRVLRPNVIYSRLGRSSPWISTGTWGDGRSSGGFSGGGSFSGGGGSFGGGGAGGSW